MKRTWLASIIVIALVIIGIVAYLARNRADETGNTGSHASTAPTQPALQPSPPPSALARCTGPLDSQISISSLVARREWAHSLFLKNHVDAALTELRAIATIDPGYPAINLEISEALLKANRAADAKDAVKLQLEISECLSNLSPSDVQAYCKSEWVSAPKEGCASELAKINQQAHYEAGLVDADLSRNAHSHAQPAINASSTISHPLASPTIGAAAPVHGVVSAPPVPSPLPALNIRSTEAAQHVGERATVCGVVIGKHTAEESNGKPTFINLDRAYPQQTFTVVIWGADRSSVGEFPGDGSVCVTGKIAMYGDNPQIVLHDAKSWSRFSQP